MKTKLLKQTGKGYKESTAEEATHLLMNFPGPILNRIIPVRTHTGKDWYWDGNTEAPTLTPSILSRTTINGKEVVCHSYVKAGMVEFLADCTHEYAGQTHPLLDVDW